LAVDGFSTDVSLEAREAGRLPVEIVAAWREKVLHLEKDLGMEAIALGPPLAAPEKRATEAAGGLVSTSDPAYYRFTQWIFLQLYLAGLVYRSQRTFDQCAQCGRKHRLGMQAACRSCQGGLVARQALEWRADLTKFGDRLLSDLDKLDCHEEEKDRQREILGRSRGCEVTFPVSKPFDTEYEGITIFTTHVEMIFGATFLLLDPYHPLLEHVLDSAYEDDVLRYRDRLKKGMEPRISAARTGGFALNPASLRRLPVLVSPLANGPFTDGAVMAVPAHDLDLFELAKRQKLPIREVIHNDKAKFDSHAQLTEPWLGEGVLTNSGPFTSLPFKVGRDRIVQLLSRKGAGEKRTRFRLKSLPLSSRSAWGPPVPLIHCKRCGVVPVPEGQLPVELPPLTKEILKMEILKMDILMVDTAKVEALKSELAAVEGSRKDSPQKESPKPRGEETEPGALARLPGFGPVSCPVCGEGARRDSETLLPWLGNAWSHLRLLRPDLAGKVEGFRDLSRDDSPALLGPPAIAAAERPARVLEAPAPSELPSSGSSAMPIEPMLAAPGPRGGPEEGISERGSEQAGGEPSSGQVLPEDVDIFSVPAGGESLRGAEGAEGEEQDDAADGARLDGELDGALEDTRAREESGGKDESAFTGEPKAVEAEAKEALQDGAEGSKENQGEDESARKEDGDEDDDEDDDDEEGDESVQLSKVSTLKPFRSPALDAFLPVDCALGDSSLRPKDFLQVRFLAKFLSDLGESPVPEPYLRYHRVGEVKMCRQESLDPPEKSRSPGTRPGPLAAQGPRPQVKPCSGGSSQALWSSGADALRLYLLFSGPIERAIAFDPGGPARMRRFLNRIWHQMSLRREKGKFVSRRMLVQKHFLIHDVTQRLLSSKFHTAVAALMRFVRFLEHPETTPEDMDRNAMKTFIILLSPFAPHLALELWSRMGEEQDLSAAPWPVASDELIHPPEREFLIFVDGKVRDRMQQPSNLEPEKLESRALQRDRIREIVGMKKVQKVVVVPQKLVSIVLAP
jgi:leucyl-tRNA synthetase